MSSNQEDLHVNILLNLFDLCMFFGGWRSTLGLTLIDISQFCTENPTFPHKMVAVIMRIHGDPKRAIK